MESVNVKCVGNGYPTIVINGGPGMSYGYMEKSFRCLEESKKLIYFDQPGCGKSKGIEACEKSTVQAFADIVNNPENSEGYNLIVHSWGTYILGSSLQRGFLNRKPNKILFLNPAPFDNNGVEKVTQRLLSRIPEDIMSEISRLMSICNDEAGKELMNIALPFYTGSNNLPDIVIDFSIATSNKISSEITKYDFNNEAEQLIKNSMYVFGSDDYIDKNDIYFLKKYDKTKVAEIAGGHFAFAQSNKSFCHLANKFFS